MVTDVETHDVSAFVHRCSSSNQRSIIIIDSHFHESVRGVCRAQTDATCLVHKIAVDEWRMVHLSASSFIPQFIYICPLYSICECKYCPDSRFDLLAAYMYVCIGIRSEPTFIFYIYYTICYVQRCVHNFRAHIQLAMHTNGCSCKLVAGKAGSIDAIIIIIRMTMQPWWIEAKRAQCTHSEHPQYARVLFNCTWMFHVFCFRRWRLVTFAYTTTNTSFAICSPSLGIDRWNIIRRK